VYGEDQVVEVVDVQDGPVCQQAMTFLEIEGRVPPIQSKPTVASTERHVLQQPIQILLGVNLPAHHAVQYGSLVVLLGAIAPNLAHPIDAGRELEEGVPVGCAAEAGVVDVLPCLEAACGHDLEQVGPHLDKCSGTAIRQGVPRSWKRGSSGGKAEPSWRASGRFPPASTLNDQLINRKIPSIAHCPLHPHWHKSFFLNEQMRCLSPVRVLLQ